MAFEPIPGASTTECGDPASAPLLMRLGLQFPFVDAEVIVAVLESASGIAGAEALGVLRDLQTEAMASHSDGNTGKLSPVRATLRDTAIEGETSGIDGDSVDLGIVGVAGKAVLHLDVDPSLLAAAGKTCDAPSVTLAVPSGELWPLSWHDPPLILRLPVFGR